MGEEGMREGRGEEGREGGRKGGARKGGRKEGEEEGRKKLIRTVGAVCAHARHPWGADACARSSQLVLLLLCPRHSMVVGAVAVWSLSWAVCCGRGWLSLLPGLVSWALIVIVGIHIQMWLLVVVGVHVHVQAVVVVDVDVGGCSACLHGWVVGGCCGWSCCLLCTYRGHSCSRAVVSCYWRWLL